MHPTPQPLLEVEKTEACGRRWLRRKIGTPSRWNNDSIRVIDKRYMQHTCPLPSSYVLKRQWSGKHAQSKHGGVDDNMTSRNRHEYRCVEYVRLQLLRFHSTNSGKISIRGHVAQLLIKRLHERCDAVVHVRSVMNGTCSNANPGRKERTPLKHGTAARKGCTV
jgi:hypothetical protein